jgi:hypothetical protein
MAEPKEYVHPLPTHVWEYTVQVENGDWHWTRSRNPIDFREAIIEALDYESSLEGGRLVSIANVDPPQT